MHNPKEALLNKYKDQISKVLGVWADLIQNHVK